MSRPRPWILASLGLVAGFFILRGCGDVLRSAAESAFAASPGPLLAAFAAGLLYRFVNAAGWGFVLRALRQPLGGFAAWRIWLLSESFRWVPGGVWGYCSRVELAHRAGVGRLAASLSVTAELVLTVLSWSLVACLAGPLLWQSLRPFAASLPWFGLGLLALGLPAALGFRLLLRSGGKVGRKLREGFEGLRELRRAGPRSGLLGGVLLGFVVVNAFQGLGLWLVLRALGADDIGLLAVLGCNAVGWLTGFFAFAAPGGLGAREAGCAALLALFVSPPQAIAAALLWRAVQVANELTVLLCLLLGRRLGAPGPLPRESTV